MINRSAFAALKGILCHFPGGRGSGRKSYKRYKVSLGEGSVFKKGAMEKM